MKVMPKYYFPSCFLLFVTIILGFILSNSITHAIDYDYEPERIDDVSIGVPVSCNLTGTNTDHTATISNGTYQSDIGTTTLKVSCNDSEGFAIYAIGYTDNTDGKNVLTNSALGSTYDIATGTATSGNNSNWAVKLATNSNATYPVTIENNFNNYHNIPDEYTLVAKRLSGTDIGMTAVGSVLTTTYQAYIKPTQPSGAYQGKVKFVLMHPSTSLEPLREDEIEVIYEGNGRTFTTGVDTNRVVYRSSCGPTYISTTPTIYKSSNIGDNGTQNGPYTNSEHIVDLVTFEGASKIRVVVDYGFSAGGAGMALINPSTGEYYTLIFSEEENLSGQNAVFDLDTNSLYVYMESIESPISGYDYGMYARLYPIYDTEQANTEEFSYACNLNSSPVIGSYADTIIPVYANEELYSTWYIVSGNDSIFLQNGDSVFSYLQSHADDLLGTTVHVYAYKPYNVNYDGNNATAGTMSGFTTEIDYGSSNTLLAPNFKKNGYGFAGWSENPNAVVNGLDDIYGPNESVFDYQFTPNLTTRESTLYAVWVPTSGTMQNWSGCSSMSNGQVAALTDNRDNNVYTVAKLADGNCWMMENLRLDNTAATLSSSNTDHPAISGLAASSDDVCNKNQTSCFNQSKLNTNNTNIGGSNASGTTLVATPYTLEGTNAEHKLQWYSYGNYYNWYSATAGTGIWSSSPTDATGSICPSGWTLPTGGNNGQFYALNLVVNSGYTNITDSLRKYPINFIFSGRRVSGGEGDRNSQGHYFSSSVGNRYYLKEFLITEYHLAFYEDNQGDNWDIEASVRCLLTP